MSVYTEVSNEVLATFLEDYDLGQVKTFEGILEGIENSNFSLETSAGRFVLTIFEKRASEPDLPYFLQLMDHLADREFPAPKPIRRRDNSSLGRILEKPAAVVSFLNGKCATVPSLADAKAAGTALARLHVTAADFPLKRYNNLGLKSWRPLFQLSASRAQEIEKDLAEEIEVALIHLETSWPKNLPTGTIHADLFPDNLFLENGEVSGVIDYYFAAHDTLAYDLAITLNSWCVDTNRNWNSELAEAMLNGYEDVRPLCSNEIEALPLLLQGAAMRFLLTRLHDWLNPEPHALVRPKDPLEQLACLRLHQSRKTIT